MIIEQTGYVKELELEETDEDSTGMKDFLEIDAVILANGDYPSASLPVRILEEAPYVVCCDGGANEYIAKGHLPDVIIGDGDSLSEENRMKYASLIRHNPDQETNDQTKAVRWAIGNIPDIDHIYIMGSTGGRADHTIGNLSLLMEYTRMFDLSGTMIEAVTDNGTAFAVNDTTEFDCGIGRSVSIFSPDNSLRIRSAGLEYPTDEVIFDNWWKASLNKAVQDNVRLEFSHRSLALIILD